MSVCKIICSTEINVNIYKLTYVASKMNKYDKYIFSS